MAPVFYLSCWGPLNASDNLCIHIPITFGLVAMADGYISDLAVMLNARANLLRTHLPNEPTGPELFIMSKRCSIQIHNSLPRSSSGGPIELPNNTRLKYATASATIQSLPQLNALTFPPPPPPDAAVYERHESGPNSL